MDDRRMQLELRELVELEKQSMTVDEAIAECSRWLAHLDAQRGKARLLQEAARMARNGDKESAYRVMRQADKHPVVYDGAKLEQAVKAILKLVGVSWGGNE